MISREIIQDGVLLRITPFAKIAANNRCKVDAAITIRPGTDRREARIFIREIDMRGLTISDTVLLIASIRAIIEEAGKVVDEGRALRAKKRLAKERSHKRNLAKRRLARKPVKKTVKRKRK